jgi:hypothetical protein
MVEYIPLLLDASHNNRLPIAQWLDFCCRIDIIDWSFGGLVITYRLVFWGASYYTVRSSGAFNLHVAIINSNFSQLIVINLRITELLVLSPQLQTPPYTVKNLRMPCCTQVTKTKDNYLYQTSCSAEKRWRAGV